MTSAFPYKPNLYKFPRRVYPDANFLVSFYVPNHVWHTNASTLLTELISKKVEIDISLLAMDEAICLLLIIKYEDQNGNGSWKNDQPLKNNPQVCSSFHPEFSSFVAKLKSLSNVKFIDIPNSCEEILDDLLGNISSYSFAPRDACHLSILKALNLEMIITNDTDFERINDLPITVLHFW